jgi:WD40 repeat protein
VAEAWLKDTQAQKKQPAATDLQKAYIAQSGGNKRKNRLLLTGAAVSVMGIMTTAAIVSTMLWLEAKTQTQIAKTQTQIATLRENAARVQNLPSLEGLVLAIKATGESQFSSPEVRDQSFAQVQSSLRNAIENARERNLLKGHEDQVYPVAFSPDGKTIVSGSRDGTIRLWDTTGKPIGQPLQGHESAVMSVAFSPDGKTIVSGSWDNTIRLWDTSGKPIGQPFKGHEHGVYSVDLLQKSRLGYYEG